MTMTGGINHAMNNHNGTVTFGVIYFILLLLFTIVVGSNVIFPKP